MESSNFIPQSAQRLLSAMKQKRNFHVIKMKLRTIYMYVQALNSEEDNNKICALPNKSEKILTNMKDFH